MTADESLSETYFDGIFEGTDDAWNLASSPYERAKFDHTIAVLDDRRYDRAFEVGCAHGVLTEQLSGLCRHLLSIDISAAAIEQARRRLAGKDDVTFAKMAFPRDAPHAESFDLVVLSEVVYYWSDGDIARAADWLRDAIRPQGRLMLVHWTGETDYPQTGDEAVAKLRAALGDGVVVETAERRESYRLDLWAGR